MWSSYLPKLASELIFVGNKLFQNKINLWINGNSFKSLTTDFCIFSLLLKIKIGKIINEKVGIIIFTMSY